MTTKKKTTKKTASKPATEPKDGNGPPPKAKQEKAPKPPKEDLVVFAFRLRPEERDLIHRAAGVAKASRFVRALSVAASRGDEKAVVEIVGAVKAQIAS